MADDNRRQEKDKQESVPRSIDDAEINLPDALPGALPENAAKREREPEMPRDEATVRMPEATAESLKEGEE